MVLASLLGVAWTVRDIASPAYDAVLDRISGTRHINPAKITASNSAPGHSAAQARDGVTNRSWAPAKAGDGEGQYLHATFAEPFRLVYVGIISGISQEEQRFFAQGRPHSLRLTIQTIDGSQQFEDIDLEDRPGLQTFRLATSDVIAVRLTIQSAHGVGAATRVAVAEIEFRGRNR